MRGQRETRAGRLITLAALVMVAGCGERRAILEPAGDGPSANIIVAAKPGGPSITQVAGGATFEIGGDPQPVAVTVQNLGRSTLSNTFIVLTVSQADGSREVGTSPMSCDGVGAGVLPSGATCEVSIAAALASTGGAGTIAAGSATLEASLRQTSGKKTKVLDAVSQATTLTGPTQPPPGGPVITGVTLDDTQFSIDGPAIAASVHLDNPGESIGGVELQAYVVQGTARRAAGGTTSMCSSGGTLPAGTCTTPWLQPFASNTSSGSGTLTAGAAQLEIQLRDNATTYDTELIDITLVAPGAASITDLDLASTTLTIDGDPVDYTIAIANVGGARSGVIVQARMVQGDTDRAAYGTEVQCPGHASGVLPSGGCSFDYYAAATNLAGGAGVLLVGGAELVIDLYDGEELLDSWNETVTLTRTYPYIASISLNSANSTLVLGGGSVGATVNVINPTGFVFNDVRVFATVRQDAVSSAAGDDRPSCPNQGTIGDVECAIGMSVVATNANAQNGSLVPGSATLEIVLRGPNQTVYDTRTIPITLVQQ